MHDAFNQFSVDLKIESATITSTVLKWAIKYRNGAVKNEP